MAGKWEFVGGKIESGESPQDALAREIREELSVDCVVSDHFSTDVTCVGELEISLRCYLAEFQSRPVASSDHDAFRWISRDALWDIDWADADIPAVTKLESSRLL